MKGLGTGEALVMDAATAEPRSITAHTQEGYSMAKEEPLLTSPVTHDVAVHVEDYERFTHLFKWGAVAVFVIAMILLFFVL
jgi:hypothetical protein